MNTATTAHISAQQQSPLVLRELALDSLNAGSQRLNGALKVRDRRVVGSFGKRLRSHEGALTLPRHDQAFVLQQGKRVLDRADGHANISRDLSVTGQLRTGSQLPLCDGAAEVVGDLLERRTRVVRVEFQHVSKATT
jgi:hypothetical protein